MDSGRIGGAAAAAGEPRHVRPQNERPMRNRIATLVVALVVSCLLVEGQALNEAFLRSSVLVTFESAPGRESFGTGFFLFRPLNGDQGHVFLVTSKHVLPPEGAARSIKIRVTVGG